MAINSLSASSKGFSGLASGLDTESMVEQMLAGTQTKIDKTNQKITQLGYKQELYRSVISDLQKFQNTYFRYTNQASNLMSQSFFNTKAATTTSSAYTVSGTTSASAGKITIDSIKSLATNYKQTSLMAASSKVGGQIDGTALTKWKDSLSSEKLTFKVGDTSVDIALSSFIGKGSNEIEDIVNKALTDGGAAASVKYLNGSFSLSANDSSAAVSVKGTDNALKLIGGKSIEGKGSASMKIDASAALPSFTFSVDGVSKEISFNPSSFINTDNSIDYDALAKNLSSSISSAFGSGITVESSNTGELKFGVTNPSRKISVSGDSDSLALLGLKNNDSNKLSLNTSVGKNHFATPVLGQYQKFSINGVDFSFSSNTSLSSIISAVNSSDAGVKMSYSSTSDTFTLESTVAGKRNSTFDIKQTEGNLMTAMFGVAASGNTTSAKLTKELTSATLPSGDFNFKGGTVNINVNGSNVALTLKGSYSSADSLVKALNGALSTQFGTDENNVANVAFSISGDTVSLKTTADYTAHISDNSLSSLGFDGTVTGATTLAEMGMKEGMSFEIDGTTVKLDASSSITNMISQINTAAGKDVAEFNQVEPYIRIFGVDIPMSFVDSSGKMFGQTEGSLSQGTEKSPDQLFSSTEGSNAVLSINGVEVERTSNSFTVDGVSYTLLDKTAEASTVTVTQDTDAIYDTVVKFVEDYNKLINNMNELLDADATYKDYAPLTTAQEDEMTEAQVEKWNEKAKEGLLKNDSILTSVLSGLRQCLYTKPEGSIPLYDLGITTSYFNTKDNLFINDTSELKTRISENPEEIMKLFTDPSSGLATMLNTAIDSAAKSSTVNPGSLVRMAGSTGSSDTSSSIYKETKDLKEKLKRFENLYENEYDRYWSQFNEMEQLISKMNSTSSWLSSMTSA